LGLSGIKMATTIGAGLDSQLLLGGAQGALGMYQGLREGDLEQIAQGTYQGLGVYSAYSSMAMEQAFQQGLQAAAEMGLTGTAATQYANQAAQNAQMAGAGSIGSWLPYIGLGLSAYDFLKDPSYEGAWHIANFAGMAFAGPAAPIFAVLGALTLGVQYYSSQKNKHKKHYIYWHTPVLDVVGQDDNGWTYLYDTNSSLTDEGVRFGTDAAYQASYGRGFTGGPKRGFFLRYNPATNELQRIKGRINSKEDFEKYFSSDEWETVDLSENWNERTNTDPVLFDPSAFQSEIYNKILIPQGYVEKPSVESGWQPVTVGGKEYLMNQDGYLADAGSGYLLGAVNPEDGQVLDFYGTKGRDRIRKDDRGKFSKDSEIQQGSRTYLGDIDNWDQVKQSLPQLPVSKGGVFGQPPTDANALLGGSTQPVATAGSGIPGSSDANFLIPSQGVQPQTNSLGTSSALPTLPEQSTTSQPLQNMMPQSFLGSTPYPSSFLGLAGSTGSNNMSDNNISGEAKQIKTPGPLPAGGEAIWEMFLNNVFGSPGGGQPSYLAQALSGQQQYLDQQNQQYVDAIKQNAQPVNQAIDTAKANPINISFGGKPVGNVMMTGGMGAEQQRMATNMLAPAAQWEYAQQNTPYTAFMQYADILAKAGMGVQQLAYGIPSQDTNMTYEGPEQSTMSKVGGWLNIVETGLGAASTARNLWDVWNKPKATV
jgi:hypothetical protein